MKHLILIGFLFFIMLVNKSAAAWEIKKNNKGHCFIESVQVEIKDGYQKTQAKLQLDNNQIRIVSKAPLDKSLNDLGLSVETGSIELERSLKNIRGTLQQYDLFSKQDLQQAEQKKKDYEQEVNRIISHKWYKDYDNNPINSDRFDKKMAVLQIKMLNINDKIDDMVGYLTAKKNEEKILSDFKEIKKSDFVIADFIDGRKVAVFNSHYEKLLNLIKEGGRVRIQLRFWPSWPITSHQEAYINLEGFNDQYKNMLSCTKNKTITAL